MSETSYEWTVVGAGPAGIAAVGKLLDSGVDRACIAWIDPEFAVGDFGSKWHHIPSNTNVGLFMQFLNRVKSFGFHSVLHQFELSQLDTSSTCLLKYMVEPLKWVTQQLMAKVTTFPDKVTSLTLNNQLWHIALRQMVIQSRHVILATGSEPRTLDYSTQSLPLTVALNPDLLKSACKDAKRIAVFGSSHSAILAMRNIIEAGLADIVNFYQSPLRYAVQFDDWIMYDDTGLKGTTAQWARSNINNDQVKQIKRYYSNEENIATHLPTCDRVVYAVGFERRQEIEISGTNTVSYDRHSGIIAPGLFGFGIAFPEAFVTPLGSVSHRVGLWKFLDYLERIMPIWLHYHA